MHSATVFTKEELPASLATNNVLTLLCSKYEFIRCMSTARLALCFSLWSLSISTATFLQRLVNARLVSAEMVSLARSAWMSFIKISLSVEKDILPRPTRRSPKFLACWRSATVAWPVTATMRRMPFAIPNSSTTMTSLTLLAREHVFLRRIRCCTSTNLCWQHQEYLVNRYTYGTDSDRIRIRLTGY